MFKSNNKGFIFRLYSYYFLFFLLNGQRNYEFSYDIRLQGGSIKREEKSGTDGRVTGHYTIRDYNNGFFRIVEYTADASGFKAKVITNEPGTQNTSVIPEIIQSSGFNKTLLYTGSMNKTEPSSDQWTPSSQKPTTMGSVITTMMPPTQEHNSNGSDNETFLNFNWTTNTMINELSNQFNDRLVII